MAPAAAVLAVLAPLAPRGRVTVPPAAPMPANALAAAVGRTNAPAVALVGGVAVVPVAEITPTADRLSAPANASVVALVAIAPVAEAITCPVNASALALVAIPLTAEAANAPLNASVDAVTLIAPRCGKR